LGGRVVAFPLPKDPAGRDKKETIRKAREERERKKRVLIELDRKLKKRKRAIAPTTKKWEKDIDSEIRIEKEETQSKEAKSEHVRG